MVEARRCNDRIMIVRIIVEKDIVSIVSAYGPQVNLGDLMRTISEDKKVFLGGDLNGYIGRDAGNYNSVHGGFGLGARNESGENLLEFAIAKRFGYSKLDL